MAKQKPSSSHHASSNSANNPLTTTYSNASSIHPTSSNTSHLPQHIYFNPDLRRDTSNSLTPPTTISMPIPPLPQRHHATPATSTTGSGGLNQLSAGSNPTHNAYRETMSNPQRERDRDFRSFSYNSVDHQENPLPSNSTAYNGSNPHHSMISTNSSIASSQSYLSQASSAAAERAANNPNSPSRSSSSSSHSSFQSYQPSHTVQTSSATQLSPVSSARSANQAPYDKKPKSLISRTSMTSIQSSSSSVRSSVYDDNISFPTLAKKAEHTSIQRPKDDAEVEKMFVDLMVRFLFLFVCFDDPLLHQPRSSKVYLIKSVITHTNLYVSYFHF